MVNDIVRRPRCPNCNGIMVFTFSFPGQEYACVPCGTTEQFLCKREEFPGSEEDQLIMKWAADLIWIGIRWGGGTCQAHNKSDCRTCAPDGYVFKFYRKNAKALGSA